MKLLKVRFENFRIIQKMDWIPIKKLMILTGENDGGKTSTLNALEIFLDSKAAPDKSDYMKIDNFGNAEKKISMFGVFSLDSSEKTLIGVDDRDDRDDNILLLKVEGDEDSKQR